MGRTRIVDPPGPLAPPVASCPVSPTASKHLGLTPVVDTQTFSHTQPKEDLDCDPLFRAQ